MKWMDGWMDVEWINEQTNDTTNNSAMLRYGMLTCCRVEIECPLRCKIKIKECGWFEYRGVLFGWKSSGSTRWWRGTRERGTKHGDGRSWRVWHLTVWALIDYCWPSLYSNLCACFYCASKVSAPFSQLLMLMLFMPLTRERPIPSIPWSCERAKSPLRRTLPLFPSTKQLLLLYTY